MNRTKQIEASATIRERIETVKSPTLRSTLHREFNAFIQNLNEVLAEQKNK